VHKYVPLFFKLTSQKQFIIIIIINNSTKSVLQALECTRTYNINVTDSTLGLIDLHIIKIFKNIYK